MRDRISLRGAGWIAGQALAGLGAFFLYGELSTAAAGVKDMLDGGSQGLGILPSASLAILHVSHAADIVHPTLVWCWPLLLVAVGVVLARDCSK